MLYIWNRYTTFSVFKLLTWTIINAISLKAKIQPLEHNQYSNAVNFPSDVHFTTLK